jgi:hypothetical protein
VALRRNFGERSTIDMVAGPGMKQIRAVATNSCNAILEFFGWGAGAMFDVYLNDKRDLLVVRKGLTIPELGSARWRKKKTAVSVSDEISRAVQKQGYYIRKRKDARPRPSS